LFPSQKSLDNMVILGIETSCDETSVGILKNSQLVANLIASQENLHSRFGGIVPEIASRAHLEKIVILFNCALKKAGISSEEIDAIGVTNEPGLKGSLMIGVSFATGLAYALKKPVYHVNHLHAHLAACYLNQNISFPALGLIISGGHTNLYLLRNHTNFHLIGKTRDDACGEVFDKVGRMLNLPFPGGIHVEKLAQKGDEKKLKFPVAYIRNSLDFSFSGIKTAVYYYILKNGIKNPADIAASFQKAITDSIIMKINDAINMFEVKDFLFGGGVIRNEYLRKKITEHLSKKGVRPVICPPDLCTDNGGKVAILTSYIISAGKKPSPYKILVYPTK